jgi:hypothetical protein
VIDVDRTRTHSGRGRGTARGQTLHDYVAGISVFVLTVGLVLSLLPAAVAPFEATEDTVRGEQASRIGSQLVSNLSADGEPNVLGAGSVSAVMDRNQTQLRDRFGLASVRYVNLTLTSLNGSLIVSNTSNVPMTAGASAAGENAVAAARIVRTDGSDVDCTPACRLLVRVW